MKKKKKAAIKPQSIENKKTLVQPQSMNIIFALNIITFISVMLWFATDLSRTGLIKELVIQFIGFMSILILGAIFLLHERIRLLRSSLNIPMIVWALVIQISFIIYGPKFYASWYMSLVYGTIALYFSLINSVNTKIQLDILWFVILVSLLLCGIYGLLQHFGKDFIPWDSKERIFSTFGNPTFYSAILAIFIPLVLSLAFYYKNLVVKCLTVAILLLLLADLYWTKSRASMIGLFIGMLLYTVFLFKIDRRKGAIIGCVLGVLLLLGSLGAVLMPNLSQNIYNSLWRGATLKARYVFWEGGWKMFLDSPIIGQGIGCFNSRFPEYRSPNYLDFGVSHNTTHAHNECLEILGELGVVGLTVFLIILYCAIRTAISTPLSSKSKDKALLGLGVLAGFVAFLIDSLASPVIRWVEGGYCLYFFLALIVLVRKVPFRGESTAEISDLSSIPEEDKKLIREIASFEEEELTDESPIPEKNYKIIDVKARSLIFVYVIFSATLLGGFGAKYLYPVYMAEKHCQGGVSLMDVLPPNMTPQEDRARANRAISEFEKSIDYWPSLPRPYYRLGALYSMTGEYQKSLEYYLRLKELAPNYAEIHHNMAGLYPKLGMFDKALEEAYLAVRFQNSVTNRLLLIRLLIQIKSFEKAKQEIKELEKLKPDPVILYQQWGLCYMLNNEYILAENCYKDLKSITWAKYREARKRYQDLKNEESKSLIVQSAYAFIQASQNLINYYTQFKRYEEAKEEFSSTYSEVDQFSPQTPELIYTWLTSLAEQKAYQEVESILGKLNPAERKEALRILLNTFYGSGKLQESAILSEIYAQLTPEDTENLIALSNIHFTLKNYSKALLYYEEACKIQPKLIKEGRRYREEIIRKMKE